MKTVIITGASAGIGQEIARVYARKETANLVIAARNEEKLHKLKAELEQYGSHVLVVKTDVTRLADINNLFEKALKKFGHIDMLINNAGIGYVNSIDKLKVEEVNDMIDVNIRGAILVAKKAAEIMVGQREGHIVNLSSVAGYFPVPFWSIYCASKFALRAFSDCIREELSDYNIYVTSIHPGPIRTEFWQRGKIKANEDNMMSVEEFAEKMYKAVAKRKKRAIIPFSFSLMERVSRYFPVLGDLFMKLSKKQYLD